MLMRQIEHHTVWTDKLIYDVYLKFSLPTLVFSCPWPSKRGKRQHADEPDRATHSKDRQAFDLLNLLAVSFTHFGSPVSLAE
jgi:hypothetical protein